MNPRIDPIASQLTSHGLRLETLLYNTGRCMVFTVFDEKRSHQAVLKLERHSCRGQPNIIQREIENQLKCKHPSIVEIYDYFWLVMNEDYWVSAIEVELMQKDLATDIKYRKTSNFALSELELYQFLVAMVEALSFAQSLKVAHRDIKPHNILIKQGVYKLGDFGSSKELLDIGEMQSITGTPTYLSPILRKRMFDKGRYASHNPYKSDVFSLGLTFLNIAALKMISDVGDLEENIEAEITNLLYSENMKNCLRWMLSMEERERPDFLMLQNYLQPLEASLPSYTEPRNEQGDSEPISSLTEQLVPDITHMTELGGSASEQLYSELEAMQCSHTSDRSIELPCSHIVCKNCLLLEITNLSTSIQLKCPICGETQDFFRKPKSPIISVAKLKQTPLKCEICRCDKMLINVNESVVHGIFCISCVEKMYDEKVIDASAYIDALSQSVDPDKRVVSEEIKD